MTQDPIDWVKVFKERFPFAVHVPDDSFVISARFQWLRTHVGDRGDSWQFPYRGVYVFKQEADAVLFSLTWGA